MIKKLYLMVTSDEYELPIIVTDSVDELAEKTGRSKNTIQSEISHYLSGRYKHSPFRRIEFEDESEGEDERTEFRKPNDIV